MVQLVFSTLTDSFADSSPNQKRKIIDLQDADATVFAPTVVAKEPKRFHEPSQSSSSHKTSAGDQTAGESSGGATTTMDEAAAAAPSAITPSNLLRPMTKIDIKAGATTSLPRSNASSGCTKSA
ncbi:hypothetical protein PINS_up006907 [Pythium insidiosum]|nr:hypothetical protein PINS_up006907 [Pythium insidiosum]